MTNTPAQALKELVDSSIDTVLFPVKKGNRINIGSYSIKYSKGEYSVKCYRTNTVVAKTFTKAAALAIAKRLNKKQSIEQILELDDTAAKHHTDCIFYNYTMNTTKNDVKREVTQTRYDISKHHEHVTLGKIKQFIY
jgi:hypothetical protein